jgi:twitching motility two-component system response regulator PilG
MSVGQVMNLDESQDLIAYQAQDLARLLESLQQQQVTGILELEVEVQPGQVWRRLLVWYRGEIAYGSHQSIDVSEFIRRLIQKYRPEYWQSVQVWLDQQLSHPCSLRQLLKVLVERQVLTWEQIESWAQAQVVFTLEQAISAAGKYRFISNPDVYIYYGAEGHGLNWNQLILAVNTRQQYWSKIKAVIPHLGVIPLLPGGEVIAKIPEPAIGQHMQKWFDGKRSIIDIALELDRDPLQIARSYAQWVQVGWLKFKQANAAPPADIQELELPIVLSVDDSPIVQTRIKRALNEHCQVLLANDAMSALHLLARQPVDLILLDVTMPGIDGIELCQTLRRMTKFAQLPIVMLSAKDKTYDRTVAEMVGATEYLAKPIDDDKLLEVVNKYVRPGHIENEG